MEQYGKELEGLKTGDLPGQFPVGQGYFTVYESNAHLIGHISDPRLRDQIVRTYIVGNGMVDTVRLYNELLSKAEQALGVYKVGSNEALRGSRQFNVARDYAMTMKAQHERLKEEVSKLQKDLERFANERTDDEYAG